MVLSKHNSRRKVIALISIAIFIMILIYIGKRLTIITGYAAKGMCSSVFVADRNPESVQQNDLNFFPVNLATTNINTGKKEVSATIFGLAKQKAVYHEGCGCSLVSDKPTDAFPLSTRIGMKLSLNPDTINWPAGDKLADTIPNGLQIRELKHLVDLAFDSPGKETGKQTTAIIVVYKDQLLVEKYAGGFTRKTRMLGWSMTKSIMNAMVGVLVKEKKLDINAPVPVKEWEHDKRNHITLNNLLHMNSGLKWTENYFDLSDATNMLFKSDQMYNVAIHASYLYPPDSIWFYSSGTANIVSGIVRNAFSDEATYLQFPYKTLFNSLNMRSMILESDASGTFVGSSYSFATARDWARFGMLYLHDGVWQGKQILPEGWVTYSTTPAKGSRGRYGAFFWLNKNKFLPDVPVDAFYCDGFKGQRVFIIPSRQLVIVRLGFSYRKFNFNEFVSSVIRTLPSH